CIGIDDVKGVFEWALHYRQFESETLYIVPNATSLPQLNTWYFIECGGYVSSTNGFAEAWVNGALIENETGLDNAPIGNINQIWVGLEGADVTHDNAEDYLDNITLSSSYVPYVPLESFVV